MRLRTPGFQEASVRDLLREPIEGQVAAEIAGQTFPHPSLRLTKPKPAPEIRDEKERSDERRAGDSHIVLIYAGYFSSPDGL
jgi:hypothetical protein